MKKSHYKWMMTGGTPNFGNLHILPVKHMWFSMILKNHLTIKEVMLAYGTLQAWGRYIWKTVQYVGDLGYHQHLAGKYLTSSIFTKFVQPTDLTGLLKTCSCLLTMRTWHISKRYPMNHLRSVILPLHLMPQAGAPLSVTAPSSREALGLGTASTPMLSTWKAGTHGFSFAPFYGTIGRFLPYSDGEHARTSTKHGGYTGVVTSPESNKADILGMQ